ncbi:hypothetical protein GC207_13745 [bacterium]|nr:hypothetical protein [bacterium]
MLVKVFTSKGPLNGVHGRLRHRGGQYYSMDYTQSLEEEINRWLCENPAIEISQVQQSSSAGWFGRLHCVVTVWYEPSKTILTKEEAQRLVLTRLNSSHTPDEIVITETIERPFGWVFCYNSKSYVETGDDGRCLSGNHPILVDRYNSTLHFTGLGNIEDYIDRYERTGQTRA